MTLEIRVRPLTGSALARDYLASAPALTPFFPASPWDPEPYRRKAAEVDERLGRDGRAHAAEMMRATSPGAAASLERLVEEGGVLVTTGQQAGLFASPLYTVHKILTAIRLARSLEPVLERPVLPLFWVGSDDHDWDEVRHTTVLDTDNRLVRIELPPDRQGPNLPMSRRRLGMEVEAALETLERALPPTDFAPDLMGLLRRAYRPERTMGQAFADVMADLFAPFDLLMVDAGDPRLKDAAAPVIRRELEGSAEHERLLARQTERLKAAGYPAQVPIAPGASNVLALDDDGARARLVFDDGRLALRGSGRSLGEAEVLDLLAAEPERFSPNVLLRPVVESAVLPTVAYVAGPGELAYWAQIGCLFQAHDIRPPVVFPRFSVVYVEAKVAKVLEKMGLSIDDFRGPLHELEGRIIREDVPEDVTQALGGLRRAIGEGYGRLEAAARAIDPTLKGPVNSARGSAFHDVEQLEKKIVHHLKLQRDVELEQLRKVAANLYPDGKPQERVLNPFHYLVRYGRELLERTAERMEPQIGREVESA